jgi:hypothetical protein
MSECYPEPSTHIQKIKPDEADSIRKDGLALPIEFDDDEEPRAGPGATAAFIAFGIVFLLLFGLALSDAIVGLIRR